MIGINMKKEKIDYLSLGICVGLLLGIALGCFLNNLGLWMSIGICIGICISYVLVMIPKRALRFYKPKKKDLWFRESLLKDAKTMKYNHNTIDFSKDKWNEWYDKWFKDKKRFYRYLVNSENKFVGEAAYYLDEEKQIYLISIIILDSERGKGYGKEGIKLICNKARKNKIKLLYDNIAIDNSSIKLFYDLGFKKEFETLDYIMVKKEL